MNFGLDVILFASEIENEKIAIFVLFTEEWFTQKRDFSYEREMCGCNLRIDF